MQDKKRRSLGVLYTPFWVCYRGDHKDAAITGADFSRSIVFLLYRFIGILW